MPGFSRILSVRSPGRLSDLAERDSLIASQRVRRRRAARRASTALRWLAFAAALLILMASPLALTRWLLSSPRFAISRVEVNGVNWLTEAEVQDAAGIEVGQNLFALDPEAIAERLERLPWVKHARVIRSLPNRVVLMIEERQPFALAVGGGRLYWIDEEGNVLGPEPRAVAPGLPVIAGRAGGQLLDGGAAGADRVRVAVAFLRTILRSGSALRTRISEIDVGRADEGPILYTVDGIEVRLGSEWWEERLGRLEGVLAQLESEKDPIESIDLRFRDQVVLTPRK